MNSPPFFWLHIKKSAGISTRQLLQPHYVEVDRTKKPKNFIQASPVEYNDILNNYRVVLGEYQFRRCLFAKKYLYPNDWDNIFSFAFSREPTDRCISMFYYLFWKDDGSFTFKLRQLIRGYRQSKKLLFNSSYAFDSFLDFVIMAQHSDSIFQPKGHHFSTHVAPMWNDVTDLDGNILLTKIFRLENLYEGINHAFEACGIDKKINDSGTRLNKNKNRRSYRPSKSQLNKIKDIYKQDFEIYENSKL